MVRGGYPRLYDVDVPERIYYSGYINTYLERDISGYLDVRNLSAFRTFLSLCARNAGNLLNISRLASDAGVSSVTAKAWLSMLESSYVVFMLRPYHANVRKRLTKTPKLYFYDSGLLCHLLGIASKDSLLNGDSLGMVFENLIIAETAKRHLNHGVNPNLCFYRDDSKIEVDLLDLTDVSSPWAIEIKASETYHDKYARNVIRIGEEIGIPQGNHAVVLRVQDAYETGGIKVIPARTWLTPA